MTTIRPPGGIVTGLWGFLEHPGNVLRCVVDHLSARRPGPTALAEPRSESCSAPEDNGLNNGINLHSARVSHWVRVEWI